MPAGSVGIHDVEAVRWIERNLVVIDDPRLDRRYTLRQVVQAFVAGRRLARLSAAANDEQPPRAA